MDPQIGEIASGDLLAEDGKIVEVGKGISAADA